MQKQKTGAEVKLSNLKQEGMQVRSNNEECACWTHGHGTTKISKQCNLQPSSTRSVRQLTWRRESYIALLCRRFCQKMLDLSGCDAAALDGGWRLPTTIGQGHTGEISLYSVLSLA